MNTEDFITYKQALALKKLGYREPCLYYYVNWNLIPNNVYAHRVDNNSFHRVYNVKALSKVRNVAKEQIVCDAPTLAQVQKWLRKEKGLFVEAHFMRIDAYTYEIHGEIHKNDFTVYSIPEEALSAGITECLKLLEKEN